MTFRNIDFHESEVMRELERQAVQQGEFDLTPEEKVDIAASTTKQSFKVEPSDNLYNDLMKLSLAMRERGFVAEAEEIETNAFVYKQAAKETHLYKVHPEDGEDLLEFAYPDGDTDIAPAQNEYGKVETPLNEHKKILDIVKKQPKGKLSNALKNIAQDIVKGAQQENFKSAEQKINEHLTNARQVRDLLMNTYARNEAAADGSPVYHFTIDRITPSASSGKLRQGLANPVASLFSEMGGNLNAVRDVVNGINTFYRGGDQTPQTILNHWKSMAAKGMPVDVSKYAPELEGRVGTFGGVGIEEASQILHKKLQQYKQTNAVAPINAINQKLDALRVEAIRPLIKLDFSNVTINNEDDVLRALERLKSMKQIIESFIQNNLNTILKFAIAFGSEGSSDVLQTNVYSIRQGINSAISIIGVVLKGANVITPDKAQITAHRFLIAAEIFRRYSLNNPDDAVAVEMLQSSKELKDIAMSAKGQKYDVVYDQIKEVYPDVDTWGKFDKLSIDWLKSTKKDTGIDLNFKDIIRSNDNNDTVIKTALKPYKQVDETGSAKKKPSGRPSKSTKPSESKEEEKKERIVFDKIPRVLTLTTENMTDEKGDVPITYYDLEDLSSFLGVLQFRAKPSFNTKDLPVQKSTETEPTATNKKAQLLGTFDLTYQDIHDAFGWFGNRIRWKRQQLSQSATSEGIDEEFNYLRAYEHLLRRLYTMFKREYDRVKEKYDPSEIEYGSSKAREIGSGSGRRHTKDVPSENGAYYSGGGRRRGSHEPPLVDSETLRPKDLIRLKYLAEKYNITELNTDLRWLGGSEFIQPSYFTNPDTVWNSIPNEMQLHVKNNYKMHPYKFVREVLNLIRADLINITNAWKRNLRNLPPSKEINKAVIENERALKMYLRDIAYGMDRADRLLENPQ